jgi:hypothetical protein
MRAAMVLILALGVIAAACTSLLGIEEIGGSTADAGVTPADAPDEATDASAE